MGWKGLSWAVCVQENVKMEILTMEGLYSTRTLCKRGLWSREAVRMFCWRMLQWRGKSSLDEQQNRNDTENLPLLICWDKSKDVTLTNYPYHHLLKEGSCVRVSFCFLTAGKAQMGIARARVQKSTRTARGFVLQWISEHLLCKMCCISP